MILLIAGSVVLVGYLSSRLVSILAEQVCGVAVDRIVGGLGQWWEGEGGGELLPG